MEEAVMYESGIAPLCIPRGLLHDAVERGVEGVRRYAMF
jgi:hypothetical protein